MRWPVTLAIIGIAAGIVGEVTPLYLPNTPQWVWGLIFWFGIATIAFAFVWSTVSTIRNRSNEKYKPVWLPMWRLHLERNDRIPIRRLIPLRSATKIAYERTLGSTAAKAAESMNTDDILGYYAIALFDHGRTTLYGTRPPSERLEAIPREEYGRCGFIDDGRAMTRHGVKEILYDRLYIKKVDLNRLIAEMKGW